MRSFSILPFVLSSVGALPGKQQNIGNNVRPHDPVYSAWNPHPNVAMPGGSPSELRPGGPYHWGPGHHGHHPPGYPHPHRPGDCVQIQYDFPRGTNGRRSESAIRAAAVKQAYIVSRELGSLLFLRPLNLDFVSESVRASSVGD